MSSIPDIAPAAAPGEPTSVDVIGEVRAARARREQAERDVLALALTWATSHEVAGPAPRARDGAPGRPGEGTGEFPDAPPVDAAAPPPTDPTAGPTAPRLGSDADPTAVEESEERRAWRGLPDLTWDCAAPFAAALGVATRTGRIMLRQSLTLAHRLPRTQRHWQAERIDTRPTRVVADSVAGQPDDVCAWVDTQVARRIARGQAVGPVVADRLVQEALAALHAEELELERQQKLQARYARAVPSQDSADGRPGPDVYGLAEFVIRGEWPDITAFDQTIAALAEALRRGDGPEACEPLDVRRSIAVGILTDPLRAAALLGLDVPPAEQDDAPRSYRGPARRQRILVTFHLAADAVAGRVTAGLAPVGLDDDGRPWLDGVIREWAGRDDVSVLVRPVAHCGGCADCAGYCEERHLRHSYAPTELDRELVGLTNPRCVFPFCTTPARRCDCDHIVIGTWPMAARAEPG